jgi:hypothetical protein
VWVKSCLQCRDMQVFAKVEPGAYTEEAIDASLHAEDANNTLHDSTNGFHPPSHGHEMDGVAAPNGAETKGLKVHFLPSRQSCFTSAHNTYTTAWIATNQCGFMSCRWMVLTPRCRAVFLGEARMATTLHQATPQSMLAKRHASCHEGHCRCFSCRKQFMPSMWRETLASAALLTAAGFSKALASE